VASQTMSIKTVTWAWLAFATFAIALLLANLGVPEYSHRIHPVALRGAMGLPGALWFNVGAFVLPGGLLLVQAQGLRKTLQAAGWLARIGLTLAQWSALAFAMQGVLPLDQQGVDAAASRLHVLMWMLWWIAFVPGALLLALALRQRRGLMWLSVLAAVGVPLLAVLAPVGAWAGLAQRLAFALWFGWWLYASVALSRTSTSGAGSLPPGQR